MEGKRLVNELSLRNLLSYGPEARTLELQPLNVLIGPNASGKSNLVEALRLLRSAPRDFAAGAREGGGVEEWLWKGPRRTAPAQIDAVIDYPGAVVSLRHRLSFSANGQRLEFLEESVEDCQKLIPDAINPFTYYRYQSGTAVISVKLVDGDPPVPDGHRRERHLPREDLKADQSILSQKVDRDQFPEITYLHDVYQQIVIFQGADVGPRSALRLPQRTDLPESFLLEDASNLGLVLNDLQHRGLKPRLIELLKTFSETIEDVTVRVYGGTAQVYIHEGGLSSPVPASRLSDGALRYLCLLCILCHPSPPPLVCIEEPEMGEHPDIIRTIAGLLVEASERTQLIVTTHSDHLVSALASTPEAVFVCEKEEGATRLTQLDGKRLEKWLDSYSLGELWMSGEIGGTRW
jgi:predicted ATPase